MIVFCAKRAVSRGLAGEESGVLKYFVGEIRYEKGLSLRKLAARAVISKSYLQRIEAGEATPSLEVMLRLARALEVSLDELYQQE